MISQGRAFGIFCFFFPESVPWFTAGTFNVTKRKSSFCMRRVYKSSVVGSHVTCLSNLSNASFINDCMIQPNLKEVRISYKLDKYRFNIICYINLFSSLQPKAEWTVLSTLHTQKSFCRAGFRVCTNNGLCPVVISQKFWTKLLFKKMLPSMLDRKSIV